MKVLILAALLAICFIYAIAGFQPAAVLALLVCWCAFLSRGVRS